MNAPFRLPPDPPAPLLVDAALYDRMVRAGVFENGPRVELRSGVLVEMNPQFVPHAAAKQELATALRETLRELTSDLGVLIEVSVALDDLSMPTPDIVVWRQFDTDGPVPVAAVQLIVEVSVTTIADDLGAKARLYAVAGIAEYWVVDVAARVVHLFSHPEKGLFTDRSIARYGEVVQSATIAGLQVDTSILAR